jgi:hypothetical protein
MSSITTNTTIRTHRAQIVAEAVVSAYIHELAAAAPTAANSLLSFDRRVSRPPGARQANQGSVSRVHRRRRRPDGREAAPVPSRRAPRSAGRDCAPAQPGELELPLGPGAQLAAAAR